MTSKILNLFDTSLVVLPYALTTKLLDPVTFITIIIFNTTIEYFVLYGLIVLTLQVNFLRNLVYRVMNLGILSIFAIALWAVLTGPNFVYVVYILAFVGAVIMLFLSVILMLPSSAITPPARIVGLLALQSVPGDSGTVSSFSLWGVLICMLVIITIFTISYLFLMLVYIEEGKSQWRSPKESMVLVTLGYGSRWHSQAYKGEGPDQKASTHLAFIQYAVVTHSLFAYESEQRNKVMVQYCRTKLSIISAGNCGHTFLSSSHDGESSVRTMSPLYLQARPRLDWGLYTPSKTHTIRLLAIVYEFAEYYIRVIEPFFMVVNASRFNPLVQLTYPVRRLIGARHWRSKGDLRDYLVKGGRRCALEVQEADSGRRVIIMPFTPWWSPFNLIPKLRSDVRAWVRRHYLALSKYFLYYRNMLKQYQPDDETEFFTLRSVISMVVREQLSKPIFWLNRHSYRAWVFFYKEYKEAVLTARIELSRPQDLPLRIKWFTQTMLTRFYAPMHRFIEGHRKVDWLGEDWFAFIHISRLSWWPEQFVIIFARVTLFISSLILHSLKVLLTHLARIRSSTLESFVQAVHALSIFFLATPTECERASPMFEAFFYSEATVENLAAIQQGLYVVNPFLLFVPVTGLLVALVGAAVFKKLN